MGSELSQCSVGREQQDEWKDPFTEPHNASDSSATKTKVLLLMDQLHLGCGKPDCTNQYCASNPSLPNLGPGEAYVKALQLVLEGNSSVRLDPPHRPPDSTETGPSTRPDPPAPPGSDPAQRSPVLDELLEDYKTQGSLAVPFERVSSAIKQLKRVPMSSEAADMLTLFLFQTDALLGKGHEEAMKQVARMHAEGVGTPMSYKKALDFYRTAGVPKERTAQALLSLYEEMFSRGNMEAATQIALMHRDGRALPVDYRQCVHWLFQQWRTQNPFKPEGPNWLPDDPLSKDGKTHEERVEDARKRHFEDGRQQAERVVFDWFSQDSGMSQDEAGAESGQGQGGGGASSSDENAPRLEAHRQLSLMYSHGIGVAVDFDAAFRHLDVVLAGQRVIVPARQIKEVDELTTEYLSKLEESASKVRAKVEADFRDKEERKERLQASAMWDPDEDLAALGVDGKAQNSSATKGTGDDEEDVDEALGDLEDEDGGAAAGPTGEPQQLRELLSRIHVDDTDFQLAVSVHNQALNIAVMHIDGLDTPIDYKQAVRWMEKARYPRQFGQHVVYTMLSRKVAGQGGGSSSTPQNNTPETAALVLGNMLLDYAEYLTYQVDQGKNKKFFQERAAKHFLMAAEAGNNEAQIQIAHCYLDWIGVPIDFKEARKWYTAAGKDITYIRKKVEKKLATMRPLYKKLFQSLQDEKNELTQDVFREFYTMCLQAKGMSRRQAEERSVSKYQQRPMYEVVFRSLDVDKNHGVEFDELWAHAHTHTVIFPKSGLHMMNAKRFFKRFLTGGRDAVSSLATSGSTTSLRSATSMGDAVDDDEDVLAALMRESEAKSKLAETPKRSRRTKSQTLLLPTESSKNKLVNPASTRPRKASDRR